MAPVKPLFLPHYNHLFSVLHYPLFLLFLNNSLHMFFRKVFTVGLLLLYVTIARVLFLSSGVLLTFFIRMVLCIYKFIVFEEVEMLKGYYAIGVLANQWDSYEAISVVSGKPVDVKVNSLGGLAVKSKWCIVYLVKDGVRIKFSSIGGTLKWIGIGD
jgi:hypothetical protein